MSSERSSSYFDSITRYLDRLGSAKNPELASNAENISVLIMLQIKHTQ